MFSLSAIKLQSLFNSISPEIKKVTSLEYAPVKYQIQAIKQDVLKSVQRHAFDCASLESTSINYTQKELVLLS